MASLVRSRACNPPGDLILTCLTRRAHKSLLPSRRFGGLLRLSDIALVLSEALA